MLVSSYSEVTYTLSSLALCTSCYPGTASGVMVQGSFTGSVSLLNVSQTSSSSAGSASSSTHLLTGGVITSTPVITAARHIDSGDDAAFPVGTSVAVPLTAKLDEHGAEKRY